MKPRKPTTSSQRQVIGADYSVLTVQKPYKPLTLKIKDHAGRNNRGIITMRHQGGGHKKLYRLVDFKLDKKGVPGVIETIEYDPYRSAFISLVLYKDGERRYVITPRDLKVGDTIVTAENAEPRPGNRLPLIKIPVGAFVHNVEIRQGGGSRLARSAGTYAEVLAHDSGYTDIRLSSKEIRKVSSNAWATIGQVSNPEYNLIQLGKAGRSRWLGIRPTVRGTAMNPVDHKYGGGEGRQPRGTKRPKDIWGNITGGHKTRNRKKWSTKFIMVRRPKVR